MQTYATLSLFGAVVAYCFTDTGGVRAGKIAKVIALTFVGLFVITEAITLLS
jgi:hypothetical protein